MNTKQTVSQLRLAADILETGHPFTASPKPDGLWCVPIPTEMDILKWPVDKYEIRLALATPPDGRPLHNPDNLTADQVGAGWRLLLEDEMQGGLSLSHPGHHMCEGWKNGAWDAEHSNASCFPMTYRLPLSTPWPDPKPHVPLGPEDVPPGSVFRSKDQPDTAFWAVAQVWTGGFYLRGENVDWPLAMERMEINRPKHRDAEGNPTLWEPCHKQITV